MAERNPRIALIEPVGGHGGMNYYDYGLANGLYHNGVEVYYYTCDETDKIYEDKVKTYLYYRKIYNKSINKFRRLLLFVFGAIRSLTHAKVNKIKTAHIHLFGVEPIDFLHIFLIKLFGFKLTATVHDVESFYLSDKDKWYRNKALNWIDKFIVHNEICKKELLESTTVEVSDISVIKHGNYLPFVEPLLSKEEAGKQLGMPTDKINLLFFGQIKTVKGLDVLLNSLKYLSAEERSKINLIIAGKVWKDTFANYQQIIDENDLNEVCITRIEYIPDEEVHLFYSLADFVVLPYKKIYQSGVLLMSMSYQKPVIVSDLPAMVDIIKDEENGYVFKTNDTQSLAATISKVIANPQRSGDIAQAAIDTVSNEFDWKLIGKKTTEVYHSIL
ncbi:glycosyltransferase family 4 protein [Algivirga pacifica]|uniref:Glycosyltransferase family 4 protein n=1 Tax=Algivirga pacifica TaxID=1162670 RepID=A0ABP9D6J4_9BACT